MKMKWMMGSGILLLLLANACTKEEMEGPSLTTLYGVFDVLEPLSLSNHSPDFSQGDLVKFSCQFTKPIEWDLAIRGLESGSVKSLSGFSSELDSTQVRWSGNTNAVPFFGLEPCEVTLTFANEPDILRDTLEVMGLKVYEAVEIADFENGLPDGTVVWHQDGGNMTFEVAADSPLHGDMCFQMGGRVNWDTYLGTIDIPLDLSSVAVSAENWYVNVGIFGAAQEDLAVDQRVNILLTESSEPFNDDLTNNASDVFADGMEVYKYEIRPIDWSGWRYFGIRYSDFEVKSQGGDNQRTPANITAIRLTSNACNFNSGNCPENGERDVRTDLDYLMFTEQQPLLDQE